MIIVEGPDHAGKTTLCRRLSEELNIELSPWSKANSEARDQMPNVEVHERVFDAIDAALRATEPPVIHDRLFFSELIYGEILRGQSKFNFQQSAIINRTLRAIQCPIIWCLPPLSEIHNKILGSHQMEGVTENIDRIYEAYFRMAEFMVRKDMQLNDWKQGPQEIRWERKTPDIHLYNHMRGPAAYERIKNVVVNYTAKRKERRW